MFGKERPLLSPGDQTQRPGDCEMTKDQLQRRIEELDREIEQLLAETNTNPLLRGDSPQFNRGIADSHHERIVAKQREQIELRRKSWSI